MQETLPAIFKSIIQLCIDEDSSAEGEDFSVGTKVPINIDAQCQKIIEKINASANNEAEDEDDTSFHFGDDAEDLYDSPFEVLNQNEFIKNIYGVLAENYQDLCKKINSFLNEQEAKLLKSLIQ